MRDSSARSARVRASRAACAVASVAALACALPAPAFAANAQAAGSAATAAGKAATSKAAAGSTGSAASGTKAVASVSLYRLYNRYNGEHLYTLSSAERDDLVRDGWRYEGVGWVAPATSSTPVYRLYNPYSSDHHYTASASERDGLVRDGWRYEGVGWYSAAKTGVAVYRQFNPYVSVGTHNYTTSKAEDASLGSRGWRREGVAWYALEAGRTSATPIMGSAQTTVRQMVAAYNASGKTYPSEALAKGGAPDITAFCTILYREATSEGVRPEVVFAQAMLETGWLQFGGDVKAEQFNFSGIGATGGGNPGNSFSSVAEGLLAQAQHLKGYASTASLARPVVDPRFQYLAAKRGSAPYVEDLGGKWATSATYGTDLVAMLDRLATFPR